MLYEILYINISDGQGETVPGVSEWLKQNNMLLLGNIIIKVTVEVRRARSYRLLRMRWKRHRNLNRSRNRSRRIRSSAGRHRRVSTRRRVWRHRCTHTNNQYNIILISSETGVHYHLHYQHADIHWTSIREIISYNGTRASGLNQESNPTRRYT